MKSQQVQLLSRVIWLLISVTCLFFLRISTVQAKSDTLKIKETSDTLSTGYQVKPILSGQKKATYLPQQSRSFQQLLPSEANLIINKPQEGKQLLEEIYQQKLQAIDSSKQKEANKIHSLGDFVANNKLLVKALNLTAPIQLPVGIKRVIAGTEYIVAVDSLSVGANGVATVGVYMSLKTPQKKRLAFKGYMQVSSEGGLVGETRMELVMDIPLKFSKGVLFNIKSAGTYAVVDCNGFKEMGLKGELTFTNLVKDLPNGSPGTEPIVTSFSTSIRSWNDLVATIDLPDFQIKGIKGLGFKVEEAIFDFSDNRNALNFSFPSNYDASWLPEPNSPVWQGIYLRSFKVALPRYLKKKNANGSTSPDKSKLRNRIVFLGQNIVLDETGFTGKVTIDNLISRQQGELDGWAFSIERLGFAFQANTLNFFEIRGKINIPITDKGDPESFLSYRAMVDFYNDEFLFAAGTNKPVKVPMLGGKSQLLLTQTYIEAKVSKGDIQPKAILSGKFTVENEVLNIEEIRFEALQITKNGISNFNKVDARFGKKSAGRFPIQITEIGLVSKNDIERSDSTRSFAESMQKDEVDYIGFRMGVQINFTKDISGTGYITLIAAQVEREGDRQWRYKNTDVNGAKIDIDTGPFMFRGLLRFYRDDKTYGNGFNGQVAVGISMGGGKGFGMQGNVVFGKVNGFRYWYADALVAFTPGLPVGPSGISIYGFGGGLYYRMRKRLGTESVVTGDLGRTSSGSVYLPDENAGLGLKATVVIGLTKSLKPFYGDVTFEMAFNRSGGLRYIGFAGYGYFLNKQAKITIKDLMKTPEQKRRNAPVSAEVVIDYDIENSVFHLVAGVYVDIQTKTGTQIKGGGQMVMHFAPDEWYVHIGTPKKRLGVDVILPGVSLKTGLYLMTGTSIPEIPPPPLRVREILGINEGYDSRDQDNMFSGRGFAIGFDLSIDVGFDAFVYFNAYLGFGFDISYKKYADNVSCAGRPGPVGMKGWFGQGQTYMYAGGALGINYKGKKFPILEVSAALLAQMQFFNPFWAKGTLGGRFNILGGLVKGRFKLSVEVGNKCQLITNEAGNGAALLSSVKIISDVKPSNAAGQVDVFTAPQVAFNMPVGVEFQIEGEDGRPAGFRAKLDKLEVKAAGRVLPGTLQWNDTYDVALLQTDEVLPPKTQISVAVKLVFEERKGNTWRPVMDGKVPFVEEKLTNFTSGEAPTYIPLFNIAASYPVMNQMHMHKNETNQGFIQLHKGQRYLFDLSNTPKWATQKLRWINPQTGEATETAFRYEAANNRLVFDIAGLQNATIYQLDLVNLPKQAANQVDANVRNDAKTINTEDGDLTFANRKISGSVKNYQEQSILDPKGIHFRTSKYATFQAKVSALSFEAALFSYVAPYVSSLKSYIKGDEFFDLAELKGLSINRRGYLYSAAPLIQIEADLSKTAWYQQGLGPKVYDGYPYGNNIEIFSRYPRPYGVPPTKAVSLFQFDEGKMLNPDNLTYPSVQGSLLHVLYELAYHAEQDMRDIQLRIATANTFLGMPITPRLLTILTSRFPAMIYGDYPVKLNYVLPGKETKTTSTTDLVIKTFQRPKK